MDPTVNQEKIHLIKLIALSLAGVFGAIVFLSSFVVIKPGNSGVIFNIWTGSLKVESQGMAFRIPLITNVRSYPISLRTYTMVMRADEGDKKGDDSLDLPTKEGQHIKQDISCTYNTTPERAADVFRIFKGAPIEDIETTFVRRTIITVVQNISGTMSLSEIISSHRSEFQTAVETNLKTELDKMGFTLDKVNLGASHLPATIEAQMQQKMGAQQQAQQAEYEFQKQQTLAKAVVAQAEGQANAALVIATSQAKANHLLEQSLTPALIQYKSIEKWDGKLSQVSGGATPFIRLGKE